jgi:hypothetical protein
MTSPRYPLTILSVWVNELSYIETSLRSAGYLDDFVTTSVATAGPMQEAIEKTTGLLSYVSKQLTKLNGRLE